MIYSEFKTNPLVAHPLADQREWYADDKAVKTLEQIVNHKLGNPYLAPPTEPQQVLEGGKPVVRHLGSLTVRAVSKSDR